MSRSCGVCMEPLSSSKRVRLECGHDLCRDCCRSWLSVEKTCPFCRRPSERYSKPTRSKTRAEYLMYLLSSFHELWEEETGMTFAAYAGYDMLLFGDYLEAYFLAFRDLWYRPDMNEEMRNMCNAIRQRRPVLERLWYDHFDETYREDPSLALYNPYGEKRVPMDRVLNQFLSLCR